MQLLFSCRRSWISKQLILIQFVQRFVCWEPGTKLNKKYYLSYNKIQQSHPKCLLLWVTDKSGTSGPILCGEPGGYLRYQHDLACGELLWQSGFPTYNARDSKCAPREKSLWAVNCWGPGGVLQRAPHRPTLRKLSSPCSRLWKRALALPHGFAHGLLEKASCPAVLLVGCEERDLNLNGRCDSVRWNCVFQPPAWCVKTLLLPFLVNMKKKRHAIWIHMHTEWRLMQFLLSNLKMN